MRSKEFKQFENFFQANFDAAGLVIEELIATFNPSLVANFNNCSKTIYKRHNETPKIFKQSGWTTRTMSNSEEWITHRKWVKQQTLLQHILIIFR